MFKAIYNVLQFQKAYIIIKLKKKNSNQKKPYIIVPYFSRISNIYNLINYLFEST